METVTRIESRQAGASARQHAYDEATLARGAQLFTAIGQEGRLHLLVLLLQRGEMCVSEIAASLAEQVPTVSQRLRVLRSEGVVRKRRDGKHIYYAIADEHVARLITDALAHAHECLPGQS